MISKIKELDKWILLKIGKLHGRVLNRIMAFFSIIGTGGVVWFAICIVLVMNGEYGVAGKNMIFSLGITWFISELIMKPIVARVRPSENIPQEEMLIRKPHFYSFPSGHASTSFSVVGTACLRCSAAVTLTVAIIAGLIAFSRIYLRVHYLSDVVVGSVLGLCLGLFGVRIYDLILS